MQPHSPDADAEFNPVANGGSLAFGPVQRARHLLPQGRRSQAPSPSCCGPVGANLKRHLPHRGGQRHHLPNQNGKPATSKLNWGTGDTLAHHHRQQRADQQLPRQLRHHRLVVDCSGCLSRLTTLLNTGPRHTTGADPSRITTGQPRARPTCGAGADRRSGRLLSIASRHVPAGEVGASQRPLHLRSGPFPVRAVFASQLGRTPFGRPPRPAAGPAEPSTSRGPRQHF